MAFRLRCYFFQHQWKRWEYKTPDSCKQVRICQRCGEKDHERVEHQWKEWEYVNSASCHQERVCTRCNTRETKVNHVWGEWKHVNSCIEQRICLRDGIKENRETHDYKTVNCDSCDGKGHYDNDTGGQVLVEAGVNSWIDYEYELCRVCNGVGTYDECSRCHDIKVGAYTPHYHR